jgi:hypothetical protein
MKTAYLIFIIALCLTVIGCSEDLVEEAIPNEEVVEQENPAPPEEEVEEEPKENPNPMGKIAGTVESFNKNLIDDNYVLVNDAGNNFVYLMDKNAKVLNQWNLNGGDLGNDCFLLENGQLLAMVESDDPKLLLGGFGGKIELLQNDGTVDWSFVHSTDDYIIHHDAEMLPNGNILIMTWERRTKEEAIENGYKLDVELFPDGLIEVNPNTDEIVWEWRVWDHIVQDHDESKANFGAIETNPQLIDINYNQNDNGDITHANGIAYDAAKDVIYISANFYSEVWVIDHSTNTQEARSHSGGNYGKGGDLIYRFGNPSAYKNPNGQRLFNNNHYPNLLEGEDIGKMLIFSNGAELKQSTVYELQLPNEFSVDITKDNEPLVNWSFTDSELYSAKVSGAEKLPNGNVLITEGDYGIWEVTQEKEVVWKFNAEGFFWRAYHFNKDDPEILSLNLD